MDGVKSVLRQLAARLLAVAMASLLGLQAGVSWAGHAYSQFDEPLYPAGFSHFSHVNPKAPKGGEFALVAPVIANSFDKYNPFTLKGTAPPGLSALVFETLLTGNFEEPTTAYALLAEDVSVAPDGRSVTFRLHPKARFHNGDAVLARDVKHSFDMLTSKLASPQYSAYFGGVSRVEVLGERLIRFDFRRPDPDLPLIVGSLPVFSHKWGEVKGQQGQRKPFDQIVREHPIASGPYRIGKVVSGRDITYERDRSYWGADLNVRRGQFNFDRITYRMYLDNVTAFEGFKAGEFDFIESYISKDWVRAYKGKRFDSGELVKKTLPHRNAANFQGFIFNTRVDKFKDVRVRQAIGLAMDFEWMNRQLFYGIYSRITSYFTNSDYEAKGLPSAQELALLEPWRRSLDSAVFTQSAPLPPSTTPPGSLRANLRQARDLLAAAGWRLQDGVLRNAKGEAFTIEFLDNSPSMGRVITPLLRNLERLGIQAQYRVVDYAVYEKRMKRFEYEMVSLALPGQEVPGAELRQYYHSSQVDVEGSSNLIGVKDPVVDGLIEKVAQARTRAELVVVLRALDRVMRHQHYFVPHWYSRTFRVAWRGGRFGMQEPPPHYRPDAWALSSWWRE